MTRMEGILRSTTQESVLWWPLIAAACVCLAYRICGASHAAYAWVMLGLVDPQLLFAKIERFRRHGLDVVVACDLAAEQEGANAEQIAAAHFAWKLQDAGIDSRREAV